MTDPDRSELAKKVSELAYGYDPERAADERALAKFLQGALMASIATDGIESIRQFLKVADVEQEQDGQGNYRDYFTVVMESGARVRVTIEGESDLNV